MLNVESSLILAQRGLSPNFYAPHAEQKDNVVQFEATQGCSHGKCTFCGMYKVPYDEKTFQEYSRHVDDVLGKLSDEQADVLDRIFIGNGDVLNLDTLLLNDMIQRTVRSFHSRTWNIPRRIAMFASTKNILKHTWEDLKLLHCGGTCRNYRGLTNGCVSQNFNAGHKLGLSLVYWGVESGSDEVLNYVNKGSTHDEIKTASDRLSAAGIRKSVIIIAGLGGHRLAYEHLHKTIDILNYIKPEFVTFTGIAAGANTAYTHIMNKEIVQGTNHPLTDIENSFQILSIIEGLRFKTQVGCYSRKFQKAGFNQYPFGVIRINPNRLDLLHQTIRKHRERLLGINNIRGGKFILPGIESLVVGF